MAWIEAYDCCYCAGGASVCCSMFAAWTELTALVLDYSTASSKELSVFAVQIIVMCNGYRGVFLLGLQRVICMCTDCCKKPEAEREFSCTQYEQHCGAGAAKKWKASLRIEPGSVPEVPEGLSHNIHDELKLWSCDKLPQSCCKFVYHATSF